MSEKKNVELTVKSIVDEITTNPSVRFSKSDFQTLVFGVLSDKDFKAKKYLLRNGTIVEDSVCYNDGMVKFLDKLLKHAGISDANERSNVIDSFTYNPKDVEFIVDAVDEAMNIYTNECQKNMRMFRDTMLQLTIKKMIRSGKHAGKPTYKKMVLDRAAAANKK